MDAKAASSHTHTASEITDFDTEVANNSAVTANTAKVTNATHTGDATGSGALTVVAIQGRSVSSSAPSDGQVLKWNNSASEWQAAADNSGGGGGGGTPAGSTGQIQFNSGGSFGADSNLSWDDTNNRLGVGSSAPSYPLTIADGTPEVALEDTSSGGSFRLKLDGVGASINNYSSNGNLTFGTTGTGDFVFDTGSVGVGTGSSVNTKLHVRGNSDTSEHDCSIRIVDADGTSGSIDPNLQFWTDSGQLYQIRANDSSGLQFRNSSDVTKVTFDDDGNVGVGVTDFSSSGANAKLAVNAGFINVDDDYGLVFGGGTGRPAIQGSKADGEIYITNAKLGIGTSAPSRKLSISHDNAAALAGLEVHNSTNTGDASAWFRTPASEWALGLDKSDSSNFKISNSSELGSNDKFILTTGGNLCLGDVTPNERLDVHGSIRLSGSTRHVSFNSDDAKIVANSGTGGFSFYNGGASGTERFRIGSDGAVSLKGGRLIIGEADVASGHIDSFENLTFNIDTDNDDTNRYFSFAYDASSGAGTEVLRINETGRVTVKKSSNAEVTALTDGATITPDFDDANNFSVTLGGNRTLANPSNCTAGQSGIITITQDGTGSRTLAYGSYWKFSGGTAPTLTTTASAVDVLAYYVESATRITATLITDTK